MARPLSQLDPVRLRLASDPQEQRLWNEYVERYHPLGYKKPFGYRARYFVPDRKPAFSTNLGIRYQ